MAIAASWDLSLTCTLKLNGKAGSKGSKAGHHCLTFTTASRSDLYKALHIELYLLAMALRSHTHTQTLPTGKHYTAKLQLSHSASHYTA